MNKTVTDMATGDRKHLMMLFDGTTKKPVYLNTLDRAKINDGFNIEYHTEGFAQPNGRFIASENREYRSSRGETFMDWCKEQLRYFNP